MEIAATKKEKTWLWLLAIGLLAAGLFLRPGAMEGDDTPFHIERIYNLALAFRNGDFLPRISPYFFEGYGYAVNLFYSDFFLAVPAALVALGADVLFAYKFLLACITFGCTLSMYFCVRGISRSSSAGVLGSALYTLSAYFATDLIQRGAVGECLGFMCAPLAVWGMYEALVGDEKKHFPLILGFGGLVLSHNLTLMMCAFTFVLFMLLFLRQLVRQPRRLAHIAYSAVCVVLGCAFFLFPMLEQMLRGEYLYPYHLRIFSPITAAVRVRNLFVQTGETTPGVFSPILGLTMLLPLGLRAFCGGLPKTPLAKWRDACFLVGGICCVMATSIFPWWRFDPLLNFIQFPWRFFLFSTLLFSLGGALCITQLLQKHSAKPLFVQLTCCLVILLCAAEYLSVEVPSYTQHVAAGAVLYSYDPEEAYVLDEMYLHANADRKVWAHRSEYTHKVFNAHYNTIGSQEVTYDARTITFSGNTTPHIITSTIYIGGYTACDENGRALAVQPDAENGWVEIDVQGAESGTITLRYKHTLVQNASVWVSLAFYAAMAGTAMYRRKKAHSVAVQK